MPGGESQKRASYENAQPTRPARIKNVITRGIATANDVPIATSTLNLLVRAKTEAATTTAEPQPGTRGWKPLLRGYPPNPHWSSATILPGFSPADCPFGLDRGGR